jgi:quercetin dioxygenase-like cupin family protein
MDTAIIADARKFSLKSVQTNELVHTSDLHVELICFEAGQKYQAGSHSKTTLYQVLEGEALIKHGDTLKRLGKGKLLSMPASTQHSLENAGGGLLVVVATKAL